MKQQISRRPLYGYNSPRATCLIYNITSCDFLYYHTHTYVEFTQKAKFVQQQSCVQYIDLCLRSNFAAFDHSTVLCIHVCCVCRPDAVLHEPPTVGRRQFPPLRPLQTLGGQRTALCLVNYSRGTQLPPAVREGPVVHSS